MRIQLAPAFILHQRPYRETSLLLDLLTRDHGRIAVVARGVRKERSKSRALLQPFIPLLISFQGKTELMNLMSVEAQGVPIPLRGACLLSALYLNELLVRVLHKQDAYPELFAIYYKTLHDLQIESALEKTLRVFEKKLLQELGYGLQLEYAFPNKTPLAAEKYYLFQLEQGFHVCDEPAKTGVFSGKSLLALHLEKFEDMDSLREIKYLMRMALAPLLGSQPLQSRKLFL